MRLEVFAFNKEDEVGVPNIHHSAPHRSDARELQCEFAYSWHSISLSISKCAPC